MRISEFFKLFALLFLTQCYPAPKVAGQFTDQEFEQMASEMAKGDVPDLSPTQLVNFESPIILLDTRERAEYDMSHIPDAIWVGYDDFSKERIQHLSKETPIVTYCSVGYRSERIGEKLQKLGFQKVYNLKGSIFQWVNEERTIVDKNGEPTNKVHGFNKTWSKWVKNGQVVY